jgi:hypothetical protein
MLLRRASALLAAVAFPHGALGAQIIRDSVPPAAAPPPKPAPAEAERNGRPVDPKTLAPGEYARWEQKDFEVFRHRNLPSASGRRGGCDEQVGRLCYWYDEHARMPQEPPPVRERRERLLTLFDSLARLLPYDAWIVEQRVRYLAEGERYADALAVAKACGAGGWRCEALVGFANHLLEDYVAAERAFDAALTHMDPKAACAWTDISPLLDNVAIAQFRLLKCDDPERAAWAARTMALARPLYAMHGNDARTEWFARQTMVVMLSDAVTPYQSGFDADERELLLRFGWPRGWGGSMMSPFTLAVVAPPPPTGTGGGMGGGGGNAGPANVGGAKGKGKGGTGVGSYPPGTKIPANVPPTIRPPDMPGTRGLPGAIGGAPDSRPTPPPLPAIGIAPREGDLINVVSVEAFPAYRYIPAGFTLTDPASTDSTAWRLQLPPVMARYAPAYAKALVELEHQKAVFRRGDSALVVMAYDTRNTQAVAGAPLRVALAVTPAGRVIHDFIARRDSAPATGVLTVRAPWGPLLMSAEVAAASRHAVARARYGVGPMRAPELRVSLSDLLFYAPYGAFPATVDEAAPHALPTERVRARDKLGVYWEAYNTDPAGEKVHVSLIVMREIPDADQVGFFRRMADALGVSPASTPVRVSVDDISVRGARMSPRAIELDISTLAKGAYIVQLEITVAGQPPLRSEHRIEVTEGK